MLLILKRRLFPAVLIALAATGAAARETVSLDGAWRIVFDQQNKGRAAGWNNQRTFEGLARLRAIQVPSCWETIEQDYEGAGWYGRRFRVPAAWKDQVVRLRFGAVNFRAEVWVNDHPAGFHEGGYTPFLLAVGDLLKPGEENFIAVRVIGPIITRDLAVDGIGRNEMPHWRGAIGGGIWQTVELIATGTEFLSGVFVEPDIHAARAVVHVSAVNSGLRSVKATLDLALVGTAAAEKQELTLRPGNNDVTLRLPVPNAQLWTLERPHLYTLNARLQVAGKTADAIQQRFGMREFVIRGGSYYLNGKKIFVKAGFWEGFYPHTLAFPQNADVVRREIRLAKEAGFNVLRPWRKPPVPMILDLADEMGIMLIGAPPIECMNYWPRLSPETDQRVATEIREMILRDRNHPSIVYWELFNEVKRQGLARLKHPMSLLARDLDPTRIVVDESGGWADGAHAYPPFSYEPQAINELHSYRPAPVEPRTYNFYLKVGQPGFDASMLGWSVMKAPDGLIFMSEVGYGSWPDLPANVAQYKREGNPLTPDYRYHVMLLESIEKAARQMKWGEIFSGATELCLASQRVQAEGNRLQLEALRLNPRLAGYCLHAYTDGDWVIGAGVLDLFRNTKLVYETVKRVQAPLYVAIQVTPPNFSEGQTAQLRFSAVNEKEPRDGELRWQISAPGGRVVHSGSRKLTVASGISTPLETTVPPLAVSGAYKVRVQFAGHENEHEFFYQTARDLQPPSAEFAVLDPRQDLTPFLQKRGMRFRDFSGAEKLPVIVATDTSRDAATLDRFKMLMEHVKGGGTAVFLKAPGSRVAPKKIDNELVRTGVFPFQTRLRAARGNWAPANHGVRPHPIFEGLPVMDFMGQAYLNVCANETIEGLQEAPIVGSLSYDWGGSSPERDYRGPGSVWWGSDLTVAPYGKGRLLLSTLRIIENLGTDPVADRLLYNLVRWSASQ